MIKNLKKISKYDDFQNPIQMKNLKKEKKNKNLEDFDRLQNEINSKKTKTNDLGQIEDRDKNRDTNTKNEEIQRNKKDNLEKYNDLQNEINSKKKKTNDLGQIEDRNEKEEEVKKSKKYQELENEINKKSKFIKKNISDDNEFGIKDENVIIDLKKEPQQKPTPPEPKKQNVETEVQKPTPEPKKQNVEIEVQKPTPEPKKQNVEIEVQKPTPEPKKQNVETNKPKSETKDEMKIEKEVEKENIKIKKLEKRKNLYENNTNNFQYDFEPEDSTQIKKILTNFEKKFLDKKDTENDSENITELKNKKDKLFNKLYRVNNLIREEKKKRTIQMLEEEKRKLELEKQKLFDILDSEQNEEELKYKEEIRKDLLKDKIWNNEYMKQFSESNYINKKCLDQYDLGELKKLIDFVEENKSKTDKKFESIREYTKNNKFNGKPPVLKYKISGSSQQDLITLTFDYEEYELVHTYNKNEPIQTLIDQIRFDMRKEIDFKIGPKKDSYFDCNKTESLKSCGIENFSKIYIHKM
jgi:hypothetical protein